MALFFSRAVTSSPIKQRPSQADQSFQSLDLSLLSDDSSFSCYSSNPAGGSPCSCRRSRRLLTNGYYVLGEDSVVWDDQGNISLTPSKTNVSYKENLVRVFRRKRRSRRSLASLLSGVTETCQTWLDEKVFGGVFTSAVDADADEPTRMELSTPEPESTFSFTYDHSEIISPPQKEAPPPRILFQEEICTETCHSHEQFTQSLGGLSEVRPTPLVFHSNSCCSSPERQTGRCCGQQHLLRSSPSWPSCSSVRRDRWVDGGQPRQRISRQRMSRHGRRPRQPPPPPPPPGFLEHTHTYSNAHTHTLMQLSKLGLELMWEVQDLEYFIICLNELSACELHLKE
uniref:Transmembrane protein 71 n=1 Tax=Gadus morhua TaxID=8049 RepID=A0A8C5D196_GADMO